MENRVERGSWVHVNGTFDFLVGQGAITAVQPAKTAFRSIEGGHGRLRLKGYAADGTELFDEPANPRINSCAPTDEVGTFEEYLPVLAGLETIRLFVDGKETDRFTRGRRPQAAGVRLGTVPAGRHRIPVSTATEPAGSVNYTIQARPTGDTVWQTIGVGLDSVDTSDVDVNQFPDAQSVEVRVLQSDGMTEQEIHREEIRF